MLQGHQGGGKRSTYGHTTSPCVIDRLRNASLRATFNALLWSRAGTPFHSGATNKNGEAATYAQPRRRGRSRRAPLPIVRWCGYLGWVARKSSSENGDSISRPNWSSGIGSSLACSSVIWQRPTRVSSAFAKPIVRPKLPFSRHSTHLP